MEAIQFVQVPLFADLTRDKELRVASISEREAAEPRVVRWRGNRNLALVLAVTGIAFLLRLLRITYFNLSGDETISATFSVQSLSSIIDTLRHGEPHPPLLYVLYHVWIPLTGDGEYSMRYPAAVAGTLTVPLVYVIGKRLLSTVAGLLAAFFVATNPYQLWNSQDARMYALATFLCLGALYATARWYGEPTLDRPHCDGQLAISDEADPIAGGSTTSAGRPAVRPGQTSLHWLWLYTGCMTLALYTHYYSVYTIVLLNIFAAVMELRRSRSRFLPWVLAQIATTVLFLPWVVAASETIRTYHGNGYQPGMAEALRRWLATFFFGYVVTRDPPPLMTTLILALLLCGIVFTIRRSASSALLLVLALFLPVTGVFLASLTRPVFNERYLMAASPAFELLLSAIAVGLGPGRHRLVRGASGLVILLLVFMSLALVYRYETSTTTVAKSRDAGLFGAYLAGLAAPDDRVLFNLIDPTFDYYYRHAGGRAPIVVAPLTKNESDAELDERLGKALADAPHIWFIPDGMKWWDTRQIVSAWMDRHYRRQQETRVSLSIVEYDAVPNRHPTTVMFGNSVRLIGTDLSNAATVPLGSPWTVTLLWQTASPLAVNYTVSIQILDPGGRLMAQSDGIPQDGKAPTSSWRSTETVPDPHMVTIRSGTSPGTYAIAVAVYDSASHQRLPVVGQADGLARLGTVTVAP